jgi:hypothetical protein
MKRQWRPWKNVLNSTRISPRLILAFFLSMIMRRNSRAIDEIVSQAKADRDTEAVENVPQLYRAKGYQQAKKYYLQLSLKNNLKKKRDPYTFAVSYALVGNNQKAMDYLELAYRQKSNYMVQLKVNSYFDGLRTDPRFEQLLKRLRLAD